MSVGAKYAAIFTPTRYTFAVAVLPWQNLKLKLVLPWQNLKLKFFWILSIALELLTNCSFCFGKT
jgi:hypothetical protein